MNRKLPVLVGAAVGLVLFLALGLLPSVVYGGYAGVLLANLLFGTPAQPTLLVRILTGAGMVLGVTLTGALFALSGAAIGAAANALVRSGAPEEKSAAKERG